MRKDSAIVGLIVIYVMVLCASATREYFNEDDISNMYFSWIGSWPSFVGSILSVWHDYGRPVGMLYFGIMHRLFGFNVLPFRIGSLAVCAANLVLLNAVLGRLLSEDRARYLALLFGGFHGALWSIYASAGTIFDTLCQTFVLAGLRYYILVEAEPLRFRQLFFLAGWTALAIGAKEVGVALPLILAAYSAVHMFRNPGHEFTKAHLFRIITSLAVAVVAAAGSFAENPIAKMDAYRPTFTMARFLETLKAHSEMFLFRTMKEPALVWVMVLLGLLAVAVLLRSRTAIFGWLFYNAATLPLAFSTPRHDGYVLYVAIAGSAIYLGGVLQTVWDRVGIRMPAISSTIASAAVAAIVVGMQLAERTHIVRKKFGPGGQLEVQELVEDVRRQRPRLAPGSKVVFVNSVLDHSQPMMILHLAYDDRSLDIQELTVSKGTPLPGPGQNADVVFERTDGHYVERR